MKCVAASTIATAAVAAALLGPVAASAAQPKLMPQASESVAPKAKGPKPYQASMTGDCENQSCIVKFGKKTGKVRRITDISCLLYSSTGVALGALVRVEDRQITYLPLTSRAAVGGGEYASGAIAIDFDIPDGERVYVELASSDTATATNCVITGTIE